MKLFLGILVGVGIMGVAYWLFTNQTSVIENATYTSEVYTFTTDDSQFTVQYDENGEKALLSLNGVQHELVTAVSGSGARYVSPDGKVEFWEHQQEATVEIDSEMVIKNATLAGSEAERRRVEVLKSNKQGDPDANKYDFGLDGKDEDCDGVDDDCDSDVASSGCGAGTVLQDDVCVPEKLDADDDGDSVPAEDEATENNGGSIVIEPGATLVAHSWQLKGIVQADGTAVVPTDPTLFEATFNSEGTFNSSTDCNSVFGSYTADEAAMTLGPLASTRKACTGELLEMTYSTALSEVSTYTVSNEGEVTLKLVGSAGVLTFVAVGGLTTNPESSEATDYNSSRSNKSY